MTRPLHKVFAGIQSVWQGQLYDGSTTPQPVLNEFTGSESLTCKVWPGNSRPLTFTPTPSWISGPAGTYSITYSAANTTGVTPGYYEGLLYLADSSAPLAVWDVELFATPGTATDDLVTLPYIRAALADTVLSDAATEFLPQACAAASDSIRRYCARWFTRRTITKEYEPSYDGRVRVDEIPVNQILRVASDRDDALTITSSSTNQIARAYFATSGDRVSGLTYTGLTLVRTSSGSTTTNNLSFGTYTTVQALATAVNALGGGWTATVGTNYGAWPVTELYGGDTAQGCLDDGAVFQVYSTDDDEYDMDWETGILQLNNWGKTSSFGDPRWGAGWDIFTSSSNVRPRKVLVTHDLGFDSIPAKVQQAVVLAVKDNIRLNTIDNTLEQESLGNYSRTISKTLTAVSNEARQLLSEYRITNA